MRKRFLVKALLVAVAMLSPVMGQEKIPASGPEPIIPNDHIKKVYENTCRVHAEARLDRDVYLRGEVMQITMALSNPTSETLEVFDPAREAIWDFLHWGNRSFSPFEHWEQLKGEPPSDQWPNWADPTIWLAPGQRIEKQFVGQGPMMGDGVLQKSDRFMVYYGYLECLNYAAQAVFRVVVPTVVAATPVKLRIPKRRVNDVTGYVEETPRYTYAAVLETDEKRYVVVSRTWINAPRFLMGKEQKLDMRVAGYLEPGDGGYPQGAFLAQVVAHETGHRLGLFHTYRPIIYEGQRPNTPFGNLTMQGYLDSSTLPQTMFVRYSISFVSNELTPPFQRLDNLMDLSGTKPPYLGCPPVEQVPQDDPAVSGGVWTLEQCNYLQIPQKWGPVPVSPPCAARYATNAAPTPSVAMPPLPFLVVETSGTVTTPRMGQLSGGLDIMGFQTMFKRSQYGTVYDFDAACELPYVNVTPAPQQAN